MKILEVKDLSFSYEGYDDVTLKNVNLCVENGDFILVSGRSGSGKSTLLKLLKKEVSPKGKKEGNICFSEDNFIGYVGQHADEEIVTDKVWHEIAFGMENMSCKTEQIRLRVAEVCHYLGIQGLAEKNTKELSGGEKRLVLLASIICLNPQLILLDEPTCELDRDSTELFLNILKKINSELGISVIICEHNLNNLVEMCNKIVIMSDGVAKVYDDVRDGLQNLNYDIPDSVKIATALGEYDKLPLNVADTSNYLMEYSKNHKPHKLLHEKNIESHETVVELDDVWYGYNEGEDIIKSLQLKVYKGEILSILGGNGCGKSTLLNIISKNIKSHMGKVKVKGKVAFLPQNPRSFFSEDSIIKDFREVSKNDNRIDEYVKMFGMSHLSNHHPYDLSGGELMRAAIIKILLKDFDILLLDEPTKGLDDDMKEELNNALDLLIKQGKTVVLVSHDLEFAAEYSHRCALLFDGNIADVCDTRLFFSNNLFYTTFAKRASKCVLENAITANEVIESFGGTPVIRIAIPKETKICKPQSLQPVKHEKLSLFSTIMFFLIVPLTVVMGVCVFHDKKYLFICALLMIECMLPVYYEFEKKHKTTSLIVIVAVYCALLALSRAAFYMLPEIKPVTALVIIAGVIFGPNIGFFIGSTGMLVSNMYFGEGPWTPWQMFAMGLVGLVSGIIFRKRPNVILVAVYGFLAGFLIYGGIMNPAAAVMSGAYSELRDFIPYYLSGMPIDIIRGVSTSVFIIILYKPIVKKLERVMIKYC